MGATSLRPDIRFELRPYDPLAASLRPDQIRELPLGHKDNLVVRRPHYHKTLSRGENTRETAGSPPLASRRLFSRRREVLAFVLARRSVGADLVPV
jgi:hypothetical protein